MLLCHAFYVRHEFFPCVIESRQSAPYIGSCRSCVSSLPFPVLAPSASPKLSFSAVDCVLGSVATAASFPVHVGTLQESVYHTLRIPIHLVHLRGRYNICGSMSTCMQRLSFQVLRVSWVVHHPSSARLAAHFSFPVMARLAYGLLSGLTGDLVPLTRSHPLPGHD